MEESLPVGGEVAPDIKEAVICLHVAAGLSGIPASFGRAGSPETLHEEKLLVKMRRIGLEASKYK